MNNNDQNGNNGYENGGYDEPIYTTQIVQPTKVPGLMEKHNIAMLEAETEKLEEQRKLNESKTKIVHCLLFFHYLALNHE